MQNDDSKYTPPGRLVCWLLVHKRKGQRKVYALTAHEACTLAGWRLSDCKDIQIHED